MSVAKETCRRKQRTTDHGPRTLRRGITLTEVLISMGILTLGLLGAAALFPVGGFYMQKAEIADRGSAIAQSVMNDVVARGIVNPKSWLVMVPTPSQQNIAQPTASNFFFSGIDGKYAPITQVPPPNGAAVSGSFTRPFAEALFQALKTTTEPVTISKQFGNAFVIDPLYVAQTTTWGPDAANVPAYPFPAAAVRAFPRGGTTWPYYIASAWNPWRIANANERLWPIRRVTLQGPNGWPMDPATADYYFRANDDLATDLPSRDDRPARQNWDTTTVGSNQNVPLSRSWTGDYSWIVSVVPTTTAARDALARNPEGFSYDVSVVVFYKRPLPTRIAAPNPDIINDAASYERTVTARVISTGLNGGELLLEAFYNVGAGQYSDQMQSDPFDNLRKGEWIMMCGPHPNSNAELVQAPSTYRGEPRFAMNWYQVISIETEPSEYLTNPKSQRLVAVRGPQWPWQPAQNPGYDNDELPNNLCVGICRGAVAVHTKTMRLESQRSDGGMALTSGTTGASSRDALR